MIIQSEHKFAVTLVSKTGGTFEDTDTVRVISSYNLQDASVDIFYMRSKLDNKVVTLPKEQLQTIIAAIKAKAPTMIKH